eukprot:1280605-Amphidinium_carterae.1
MTCDRTWEQTACTACQASTGRAITEHHACTCGGQDAALVARRSCSATMLATCVCVHHALEAQWHGSCCPAAVASALHCHGHVA